MQKKVIDFSKYNPSGNMTVLVHSKHHPSEYADIAKCMMKFSHVCCEQVGFVSSTSDGLYKLEMSGHEFCGNATISYLHYLYENNFLYHSKVELSVSGRADLVQCQIHDNGKYEVNMPKPLSIQHLDLHIRNVYYKAFEVSYESYVHIIVPISEITDQFKRDVEAYVRTCKWSNHFKTIGIMLFNERTQYLMPLIYIPTMESIVWENSCGSGSASIGIYETWNKQKTIRKLEIKQPGGSIWVSSNIDDFETSIIGEVSTVAIGQAYLE